MEQRVVGVGVLLLLTLGLFSCGDDASTTTEEAADTTSPKISSFTAGGTDVSSSSEVTDVAVGAAITIVFNEAILESSLSGNIALKPTTSTDGTVDVVTALSLSEDKLTVTVSHGDLAPGVAYTLTVSNSITDLAGNALTTSELATSLNQVVTTGDSSLSFALTTSGTASDNNLIAKIRLPSADTSGTDTIQVVFSEALDTDSVTSGSVKVTTAADTTTNLCSSVAVSGLQATCTLSSSFGCDDTPTKYLVSVNADPKAEDGAHSVVPYSGYFSNLDDGFNNSSTVGTGSCWTVVNGESSEGAGDGTSEVANSNTTNAGTFTFQGANGVDVTEGENAKLLKSSISFGGPFGVTLRIESTTDLDAGESISLVVPIANDNEVGIDFKGTQYTGSVYFGDTDAGADTSGVAATSPQYLCITRNSAGDVATVNYNEDATSNTFTNIDITGLSPPTIADPVNPQLQFSYSADNMTVLIDWVRWNIGEATCPTITDVDG